MFRLDCGEKTMKWENGLMGWLRDLAGLWSNLPKAVSISKIPKVIKSSGLIATDDFKAEIQRISKY